MLDNLFETTDEVEKKDITIVRPFGGTSKIDYFRELLDEYIMIRMYSIMMIAIWKKRIWV